MNRTDELLNKYIDGELQTDELVEVQSLLQQEVNVRRLKALQVVDNSLHELDTELAPTGFTSKFMNALSVTSSKVNLSKNYFATAINIIFVVAILIVLVFAFSLVNWNFSTTEIDSKVSETVNTVQKNIPSMLTFFKNKTVMVFGSCLSLMLLLGAYYSIEAHRAFKRELKT